MGLPSGFVWLITKSTFLLQTVHFRCLEIAGNVMGNILCVMRIVLPLRLFVLVTHCRGAGRVVSCVTVLAQ